MVLSYISFFYYIDQQNSQIIKKPCEKIGDNFVLYFKRPVLNKKKFEIINLRPGRIFIKTRPKVNSVELVTNENVVIQTEKIHSNLFQKDIKKNLVVSAMRLIPKSDSVNKIVITISRRPFFSFPFILYQIAFLLTIFSIGSLTAYFLYSMIVEQKNMESLPSNLLLFPIIALITIVTIYFVLNIDEYLNQFNRFDLSKFLGRTVLFNFVLASALISLFFLFSLKRKGEKLPFGLPVFISLPILFLKIPICKKDKLTPTFFLY